MFQVAQIASELSCHDQEIEQIRSLGKELVEDARTGDVRSLKDALSTCENNWSDLCDVLRQCEEEMQMRMARCTKYDDAKHQVYAWLADNEQFVDSLEPAAVALEVTERHIEELQVIVN